MARTPAQIQAEIIAAKEARPELAELTSTSKSAVWLAITFIIAYAIYVLEVLFDTHKAETDSALALLKPHQKRWYRQKALSFQYGFELATDSDVYDNSGIDENVIAQSKIIKYAAVTEAIAESRVIVKIATEIGGVLSPITNVQKQAFDAFIEEVKDAGVKVSVINFLPDRLFLNMRIFYDPLVLDAEGNSIIDGGKPVEDAIVAYLRNLPFDGQLVLAHLIDALQLVPGVKIPHLDYAASSWIKTEINDYGEPQAINVRVTPESGYFKVIDFNGIAYLAD